MHIPEQVRALLRPQAGWYGLIAAIGLTWIGMEAIATAAPAKATAQAMWIPIAVLFMLVSTLPHPRILGLACYPMMVACMALLFVTIMPMPRSIVPPVNGATCWIDLGFTRFQPAELAKVVWVLALAWYLRYRDSYRTLTGLLVPFAIMFAPMGVLLKQPDLGLAMLYPPTLFAMLVAAGAKLRHLGALIGIGLLAVVLNVSLIYALPANQVHPFLKDHQVRRIKSTISLVQGDDRYNDTDAFQQRKGIALMGAGGLTGYGADRARVMIAANALPWPENDMIFVVIVARWGLMGGLVTLGLYLMLILSFVQVAARSKDPFVRLVCAGFAGLMFTQTAVNIGMTVGLLPITGINLPFVSYGGTSLVSTFIMMGLVLNFGSRRPTLLSRPSFEFDNLNPQGEKLLIRQ